MEGQPAGKLTFSVFTKALAGELIGVTKCYVVFLFVPLLWQV